MSRRSSIRTFLRLAALPLLVSCAAPSDPAPGPEPGSQVVLLLTLDTLRADRLGCGGDARARTPHLDRLARSGVQFAEAISPVPLTAPAHATILTGRVPPEHGVRDNGLYRLPADVPTVAEAFGDAGWRTAAFLGAYPLARRFGLGRGFEIYHDAPGFRAEGSASAFVERPADAVNRDAFSWLDENRSGEPLFLWVHYFDPHAPYDPPSPYVRLSQRDAYRGEIHFSDTQVGRLFDRLEDVFETKQIVVTADHGESLGEHREETHGIFVYEATTRVPMILAGEGLPGRAAPVGAPVSLAAIPATLADWAGVDSPTDFAPPLPLPAVGSRRNGAPGDGRLYVESMYPRLRHGWSSLRGFRVGRWKVIRAPEPEIYDLVADPGERTNLQGSPEVPTTVVGLLDELAAPRWADVEPSLKAIDPSVEEALRSLGYAAVDPDAIAPSPDELPDPKSRVRLERILGPAASALENGALQQARAILTRALSIDPKNKETNILLARLEAVEGNDRRATGLLEWCLTIPPRSMDSMVHFTAGLIALERQRWPEAEERFGLAIAGDPLDVHAHYNWGLAAFRMAHWEQAIKRWEGTLALDPGHPPTLEMLSQAREHRGDAR